MASEKEKYAEWLVANEDKKGTPDFEAVANEFRRLDQPELVAGGSEGSAARARNLQKEMGLNAPVVVPQQITGIGANIPAYEKGTTAPIGNRFVAGFAPTVEDKKAYYEMEYGEGSVLPVSPGNFLLLVPDGKGGENWVVENPQGFDTGDIMGAMGSVPELITALGTAAATMPGPQASIAKLMGATGLTTLASKAVGGAQDALFRKLILDKQADTGEIIGRRGREGAVEMAMAPLFPLGAGKVAAGQPKREMTSSVDSALNAAGERLDSILGDSSSPTVGAQIENLFPAKKTAGEAGEAVASVLRSSDRDLAAQSATLAGRAGNRASQEANNLIGEVFSVPVSGTNVTRAATGGVQLRIKQGQEAVDELYQKANSEIAKATGGKEFIINLDETGKLLEDQLDNMPRTADGKASAFFEPFARMQAQLTEISDISQKLKTVRQMRSWLGERFRLGSGPFSGMDEGLAKRLYGTMSNDIDKSVASYTGAGAQALKNANNQYKKLLEPFESNRVLNRLSRGEYENDELISAIAGGGIDDLNAIRQQLGGNTYNQVRRAALQQLQRGSIIAKNGREMLDVGSFVGRLRQMDPEVRTELLGGPKRWEALEALGDIYKQSQWSVFSSPSMPSLDDASRAMDEALRGRSSLAEKALRDAYSVVQKRRDSVGEALISQTKSGNTSIIVANPEEFLDTVIFNPSVGSRSVAQTMNKLTPQLREEVQEAAYARIFERSKDALANVKGARPQHNTAKLVNDVLGSDERRATMRAVLGEKKYEAAEAYIEYMALLEVKNVARKMPQSRNISGLIATIPYPNLFAARLTSFALERASGRRLLAENGVDVLQDLAKKRKENLGRGISVTSSVVTQGLVDGPDDPMGLYLDMMSGLTPEQRDIVDAHLTGQL